MVYVIEHAEVSQCRKPKCLFPCGFIPLYISVWSCIDHVLWSFPYLFSYDSTTLSAFNPYSCHLSILHPSGMQNLKVTSDQIDPTSQHTTTNIQFSTAHLSTPKFCLLVSIFATGLVTWTLWVDGTFFHLPSAVNDVLPRPMVMLAFLWLQWIGFAILDFAGWTVRKWCREKSDGSWGMRWDYWTLRKCRARKDMSWWDCDNQFSLTASFIDVPTTTYESRRLKGRVMQINCDNLELIWWLLWSLSPVLYL